MDLSCEIEQTVELFSRIKEKLNNSTVHQPQPQRQPYPKLITLEEVRSPSELREINFNK